MSKQPTISPKPQLVVVTHSVSPELARFCDLAGHDWVSVSDVDTAATSEPDTGWNGAILELSGDAERLWPVIRGLRAHPSNPTPTLVLLSGADLGELELRNELFDDFCLTPFHPAELGARVTHLLWVSGETGSAPPAQLVEYSDLQLNLETYQATVAGSPLDLTYMEYELLKFLAQHPGRVFTREVLLSRVWGYEYYGGARTVDVHVRRLRAKLGESHAGLIATVRSVGYRFGESRWASGPNTAALRT